MNQHATPEAIEAWVLGTLEPVAAQALEAHAEACPDCARALAREAAFEQRLHALAVAPRLEAKVTRLSRVQRPALYAATLMAAAAAVTLFLRVQPLKLSPAPRVMHCQDPGSAGDCEAKARFDGVLSLGPGGELQVPRYEDVPGSAQGSRGGK